MPPTPFLPCSLHLCLPLAEAPRGQRAKVPRKVAPEAVDHSRERGHGIRESRRQTMHQGSRGCHVPGADKTQGFQPLNFSDAVSLL